jgi:hypothetical protein
MTKAHFDIKQAEYWHCRRCCFVMMWWRWKGLNVGSLRVSGKGKTWVELTTPSSPLPSPQDGKPSISVWFDISRFATRGLEPDETKRGESSSFKRKVEKNLKLARGPRFYWGGLNVSVCQQKLRRFTTLGLSLHLPTFFTTVLPVFAFLSRLSFQLELWLLHVLAGELPAGLPSQSATGHPEKPNGH